MQFQSVGQEAPLEKEMATHSSILAWEIPWTEEPGGLQSMESQKVGHYWVTDLLFSCEVVFDSSLPHGLQHPKLPCPSPSPRVCPSSCPLNWWCHPTISLSSSSPSAFNLPSIKVFSSESAVPHRWLKYCGFSINPSEEYSGLTSFWIDWFDLLAFQEFFLAPQFKGIGSSMLCLLYCPALTSVQDYGKTIALTIAGPLSAKWCLCFWTHCLGLS